MTDDMISRETHEALLAKALGDASKANQAALAAAQEEASRFSGEVDRLTSELAQRTTENAETSKALDEAQVQLKAATDKVVALEADIAAKDAAALKAEVASKRADQVTNLALFPKEYIADKASKWADMSDEDWAERLEEWRNLKPAPPVVEDTASAMTGSSEDLTKDPSDKASDTTTSARRAILGLTS